MQSRFIGWWNPLWYSNRRYLQGKIRRNRGSTLSSAWGSIGCSPWRNRVLPYWWRWDIVHSFHRPQKQGAYDQMFVLHYLLIVVERGLLSLVGEEVFRDVFGIRTREDVVHTSLTFVIDVTGSMGDDIQAVITATQRIVTEAKDSNFVPENYVLVTFSDPGLCSVQNNNEYLVKIIVRYTCEIL